MSRRKERCVRHVIEEHLLRPKVNIPTYVFILSQYYSYNLTQSTIYILLLLFCCFQPEYVDPVLRDAAFCAVEYEDIDKLKELVDNGLNLNCWDINDGCTLLEKALCGFHTEVAEWLIGHGAHVEFTNRDGDRPIDVITDSDLGIDHRKEIKILDKYGANLNGWNRNTELTPLMNCASKGNQRNLETLLELGVDPNEGSPSYTSTGLMALNADHIDCFEQLLKFGLDPNGPNEFIPCFMEGTYMSFCLSNFGGSDCDHVMSAILAHGADINKETSIGSHFLVAVYYGKLSWANYFIDKGCQLYYYEPVAVNPFVELFGVVVNYDYGSRLDMDRDVEERDMLNKLVWGSGEMIDIDVKKMQKPHAIVEMLEREKTEFCLMSLCRKEIRSHLRQFRVNLIFQVRKLELPEMIRKYLIYQ